MKHYFLLCLFLPLFSCTDEMEEPAPFDFFDSDTLTFERYSKIDGVINPPETLELVVVKDFKVNATLYNVFFVSGTAIPNFRHYPYSTLGNVYWPIRYENGNYYEYRSLSEVIVLKDNVKRGETWTSKLALFSFSMEYKFEVIAKHNQYNIAGMNYDNVYQVKETIHSTDPDSEDLILMHYYNREYGILRRELPMYVYQYEGYIPMVFNRIIKTNL